MKILSERQNKILRATVRHYVDTIEPVGSGALVRRFSLEASSSTVRSAMGALEHKGLLIQPHISAGRVPTPKGYRHYVDCLLPPPGVAVQHLARELTNISLRRSELDDLLWQLARRLTDFTGLMSLITRPQRQETILKEIRLVQSGNRLLIMLVKNSNQATHLNIGLPQEAVSELHPIEGWIQDQLANSADGTLNWASLPPHLHLSGSLLKEAINSHSQSSMKSDSSTVFHGMSRLAAQPEFRDSKRFQPILDLLDTEPAAMALSIGHQREGVWIGQEHPNEALSDCSVVQASYRSSNEGRGQVVLVGPMRMAYATALGAVRAVASHLNRVLG